MDNRLRYDRTKALEKLASEIVEHRILFCESQRDHEGRERYLRLKNWLTARGTRGDDVWADDRQKRADQKELLSRMRLMVRASEALTTCWGVRSRCRTADVEKLVPLFRMICERSDR